MNHVEVLVTGLLLAVAALGALACRLSVPYPSMLVLGGAAFGFIPGLPEVRLEPELVLALFLPPLLYKSAIYANFGDFRTNLRGLTLSTVVLMLVAMTGVAAAAHTMIPGMSWQTAFVLGAILSPTDPVAASAIMHRLDAPRRLVSGIEGEGLFNDATALVAYRVAVAATVRPRLHRCAPPHPRTVPESTSRSYASPPDVTAISVGEDGRPSHPRPRGHRAAVGAALLPTTSDHAAGIAFDLERAGCPVGDNPGIWRNPMPTMSIYQLYNGIRHGDEVPVMWAEGPGDGFDATISPTAAAIATATTTATMSSILTLTVRLRRGGGGPGGCV